MILKAPQAMKTFMELTKNIRQPELVELEQLVTKLNLNQELIQLVGEQDPEYKHLLEQKSKFLIKKHKLSLHPETVEEQKLLKFFDEIVSASKKMDELKRQKLWTAIRLSKPFHKITEKVELRFPWYDFVFGKVLLLLMGILGVTRFCRHLGSSISLKLIRTLVAKKTMPARWIVEQLDIVEKVAS